MRRVIARLFGGSITVESLVEIIDGHPRHRYRIHGGSDDGLEFADLASVSTYLTRIAAA